MYKKTFNKYYKPKNNFIIKILLNINIEQFRYRTINNKYSYYINTISNFYIFN